MSEPDAIVQAVLTYLGTNRNQPFEKCVSEIARSSSLDVGIVRETVRRLIENGQVTQKRRAGLNLATSQSTFQAEPSRRRRRRNEKREFYDRIGKWMVDRHEWDFGESISERGKKRPRDLRAVPDVAGIKYFAGYVDRLDVHEIEVKAARPSSYDLSEAFRYSRFADFCYIALGREKIVDKQKYEKYKEEAKRLGLGILEYHMVTGQRKETKIILPAVRQNPDPLEKARFLAESLDIYQCQDCGCYFYKDEGKITKRVRSQSLLDTRIEDNESLKTAKRFRCDRCLTG